MTSWSASNCESKKTAVCKEGESATVTAVNLPWASELVTTEGAVHEVIVSGGKGTPGYLLQCFKKIGENGSEDKCTGTLNMTTTNTSSGVTATFSAGQKLECNTGSGALEGSQAISAGQGGKLSAVTATETAKLSEAEWRLGGATISQPLATGWEGKMTLNVTTLGIKGSVECEVDTAAGAVGIGGSGTVTSWNASKCVATAKEMICKVGESATVTAVNLPWASAPGHSA